MMFPGVINLTSQLDGLAQAIREAEPGFEVDLRPWGPPFRSFHNLQAEADNRATAQDRAQWLAEYRRSHPNAFIVVLGYSGGGGIAVFTVEALPEDVQVDRLILVAPAVSPDYPLLERVLPHVREVVVNYASRHDLQVGWGTRQFGTMDRAKTASAGYSGFSEDSPQLIQVYWNESMRRKGHFGNHLSYVAPAWQEKYLLPMLRPDSGPDRLRMLVSAWADDAVPVDGADPTPSAQP